MKRLISAVLALALLSSVMMAGGCAKRKVTVKSGEIVICTAGEIIEDNTKEQEVAVTDVAKYSVTTRVVTCDVHGSIASLYADAQKAITDGDLDAARAKLESVLAQNSNYKKAASQLEQIKAGKKPTPDGDAGGSAEPTSTATPDPDEVPTGPIVSLIKYIPDTIAGYSAQGITADPTVITRNYIPASESSDLLVITAEQVVDAKMAATTLASLKKSYPNSGATVDLGSVKAYFGTQSEFAFIAFSEGAVVVSVEMHVASGKAVDLKSAIVKVATVIAK